MPLRVDAPDRPKLLADPAARAARRAALALPHAAPLAAYAAALRAEAGPTARVPDFDPWDGGVGAECLFLLEAPGPRAVASGFVSRDNPDETAKNWFELNAEAGLPRGRTVTWNVVPWYVGSGGRIRPATGRDVAAGLPHLRRLLALLPRLRAVALVGRKAQRAEPAVRAAAPHLRLSAMPHPSPLFVNTAPGNRARVLAPLRDVAAYLAGATGGA
jgi:uracil-DNA glycosylase